MSVEEIKSEIENLTTKSISEVIAFAMHVRDRRDSAASAALASQTDDTESKPVVSSISKSSVTPTDSIRR